MRLPSNPAANDPRLLRNICQQVNAITDGQIYAFHGASTAAPTTGGWNKGDFIYNSNPTEQTGTSHTYVIIGWKCVAAGEPGTWAEMRTLSSDIVQPYSKVATTAVDATLDDNAHTMYVTATGKTITLPDGTTARIGVEWTVHLATTGIVTISPNTGDSIILPTADTTIAIVTKGDSLTFRCLTLTTWGIV